MRGVLIAYLAGVVALSIGHLALEGAQQAPPPGGGPADLKRQADSAYRGGDYASTVRLTSRVLSQNSEDAVAYYLRGSARVELGIAGQDAALIRQGVDDARRAIQADKAKNTDYYLPYLYGMSHLTALEEETEHAQTAVKVASDLLAREGIEAGRRSNLLYQRGVAKTKLADEQGAADDFKEAVRISPAHFAARMALADVFIRTGDPPAAEREYSSAVERFPTNPVVFNNRGMFYQSQQRHDDAIADFTKALSLDPKHLQAMLNRGFTRINMGDYEAAETDFDRAIELNPNHAPAYSLRATTALLQQNVHQALDDYLKVIELRPSYAPARADIAFAYFFARHYDTAAQAFEQAMILAPQAEYLVPWRYASLSLAGRDDAAKHAYRSLTQKPAEERTWFDLLTLYLMGRLEERDLLAAIDSRDARLRDAQLCEAYYFIGLRLKRDGEGDPSRYFRRAAASRITQLSAYRAARFELEREQQ